MVRSSHSTLSSVLFITGISLYTVEGQCYYPNGTAGPSHYHPCDPDAEVSPCCSLDTCLENILCVDNDGAPFRGLCTDPTWRSPECPSYCMEFSWAAYPMITCEGITGSTEDHCCELASFDCCQTAGRRFKVTPQSPGVWATFVGGEYSVVGSVVEVAETSSSTMASSTTPVEPMTVTISRGTAKASERPNGDGVEEEEEEEDDNDEISGVSVSTAAKVGIGIGVVAGTVLIIAVIWLAYNNRKQRNVTNSLKGMNKSGQMPHGPQPLHGFYWQSLHQQTQAIHQESSNHLPAQELPAFAGNQSRSELSG